MVKPDVSEPPRTGGSRNVAGIKRAEGNPNPLTDPVCDALDVAVPEENVYGPRME